jgi:hypothetical protein
MSTKSKIQIKVRKLSKIFILYLRQCLITQALFNEFYKFIFELHTNKTYKMIDIGQNEINPIFRSTGSKNYTLLKLNKKFLKMKQED